MFRFLNIGTFYSVFYRLIPRLIDTIATQQFSELTRGNAGALGGKVHLAATFGDKFFYVAALGVFLGLIAHL